MNSANGISEKLKWNQVMDGYEKNPAHFKGKMTGFQDVIFSYCNYLCTLSF